MKEEQQRKESKSSEAKIFQLPVRGLAQPHAPEQIMEFFQLQTLREIDDLLEDHFSKNNTRLY